MSLFTRPVSVNPALQQAEQRMYGTAAPQKPLETQPKAQTTGGAVAGQPSQAGEKGRKGKNKGGRGRPVMSLPPEQPSYGFERYLDAKAPSMIGTLHIGPRGQRWRGGKSPDEVRETLSAQFAALSDEEKDQWSARDDAMRGPLDRAKADQYRADRAAALGYGDYPLGKPYKMGRPPKEANRGGTIMERPAIYTRGGITLGDRNGRMRQANPGAMMPSTGGPGFTGTQSRGIAMRSPEQMAARNAQASVPRGPISSVRSGTQGVGYDPAAYRANIDPFGKTKDGSYQAKGQPLSATMGTPTMQAAAATMANPNARDIVRAPKTHAVRAAAAPTVAASAPPQQSPQPQMSVASISAKPLAVASPALSPAPAIQQRQAANVQRWQQVNSPAQRQQTQASVPRGPISSVRSGTTPGAGMSTAMAADYRNRAASMPQPSGSRRLFDPATRSMRQESGVAAMSPAGEKLRKSFDV